MHKNNPEFSVIICTYERHSDLRDCIESVLRQEFQSYEIIIVAPYHDKKSIEIAMSFPNVKVVLQRYGKGLSFARNLGISASLGNIVALIDDDAEADSKWLTNLHRCYTNSKIGAVGGLVLHSDNGKIQFKNGLVSMLGDIKPIEQFSHEEYNDLNNFWLNQLMGTNSSFRRDLLLKVGGFDPTFRYYFDETQLCICIIKSGYKIVHANDAIVFHKMSDGINRKDYWDNNWSQILKNTMIFSITNFFTNSKFLFKIKVFYHPLLSKMLEFYYAKKNHLIPTSMFFKILFRLFKGYLGAISFTFFHKHNLNQNWIPAKNSLEIKSSKTNEYIKKLRICLVSNEYPPGKIGGIGRYVHVLAEKLSEMGHTIHVITSEKSTSSIINGVRIHSLSNQRQLLTIPENLPIIKKNINHSLSVYKKIQEINKKFGLDIIEAPLWDIEGFVSTISSDIPIVVRVETPIFKVAEINNWKINDDINTSIELEKLYLESTDAIIAISKNIKELLLRKYNIKNPNWYFGPIGIKNLDHSKQNANSNKIILFVGRIEKRKGVDVLFKSIPDIVQHYKDIQFLFVGSDTVTTNKKSYIDYLKSTIDKKFSSNYKFLNYITDDKLQHLYQQCTVFVAPSIYESFGIIFLEAMRQSKPVIGTNVGGISEIVDDNKTGFLVKCGDSKDLSKKILKILDNPDLAITLGIEGKKRQKQFYSDESFANDTLSIYNKVLKTYKKENISENN